MKKATIDQNLTKKIKIDQIHLSVPTGSATFAEKMSNPAFMDVVLEGDKRELRSLYGKMKRLQERKKPLVKNGFYFPMRWLGNLITRLGGNPEEVPCRGTWDDLRYNNGYLGFSTETAWQPPIELLEFIQQKYTSVVYYYEAEGDGWDCYTTNDAEGRHFPSRYIVDCEPDLEYFNTIEEACAYLSAYIGRRVAPTWQALDAAAELWNDEHNDSPWPVDVKRIEVVL